MSSIFLDTKYAGMLRTRTRNFKKIGRNSFNFSCPICGDSKRNPKKARGYLLINQKKKNGLYYFCHNCNAAMPFWMFLKEAFPFLYEDYKKENLMKRINKEDDNQAKVNIEHKLEERKRKKSEDDKWKGFLYFPKDVIVPVLTYLKSRMIPDDKIRKYFSFTPDFWGLAHYFTDGEIERKKFKERRIIIKMLDESGDVIALQGRKMPGMRGGGPKYITIKKSENHHKIFGLDSIDVKKPVIICEGPIDSMFLSNALAVCGADLVSQFIGSGIEAEPVFCFDNEPRNKHIVKRMAKAIDNGYKVVIWPKDILQKDINDMVIAGLDVQSIVDNNTFSGLRAKTKFAEWKKIRER